ncbi:acyltransferase family protein [Sphingopyxis sp. KK2]|uniref:acyltransferase family protein n=1 Tax=Sphingopyxis sp. KK2 TaxID=1855727 RepID=UPI00097E64FC|nr:acyltransferase family protein [Sphingopyxis sp. KK2]
MGYRSEIDGLRAVAVIPVILFHAGASIFGGGFVGVDVFFVISGYLITGILIDELESGKFSIVHFYERRARRILPALFLVIFCCIPFALIWMTPNQLSAFARSAFAVVIFSSNFLFWREQNYFSPTAELSPLLHTWSLAVEEQYYLVFPVLLLLLWRLGRRKIFLTIVAIAVFSLLASEWAWRHQPSANFFLAPTRAWELMAGSACAFMLRDRRPTPNNWLSAAGLAMIFYAVFTFDEATPFPSLYAIIPVVGTMLVILFASGETWVNRLLSLPALVGVGLISYSAYLWHQPLFAFARIRSINEPAPILMALLALASLILAYFSWRFVEQLFRKPEKLFLPTRGKLFTASAAVAGVIAILGVTGHYMSGLPQRFDPAVLQFAQSSDDKAPMTCFSDERSSLPRHPRADCLYLSGDARPPVLIIGDSHAWAASQVMMAELQKAGISYYYATYGSCLPLAGFRKFEPVKNHQCSQFNRDTLEFARSLGVGSVVLMARFPMYLRGDRYDNGEGGIESGDRIFADLDERTQSRWDDPARRMRVLHGYESRIRELASEFNVVLVYPVPEAGWNVPRYAFKKALFDGQRQPVVSTSYNRYKERTIEVRELFDRLVTEVPSVHAARVESAFCVAATDRCVNADAQGIYYYDDDHLSNAGARRVVPIIINTIKESRQPHAR